MTNIATKNGSIIVKDGSVAEDCNCCGGWWCDQSVCWCCSLDTSIPSCRTLTDASCQTQYNDKLMKGGSPCTPLPLSVSVDGFEVVSCVSGPGSLSLYEGTTFAPCNGSYVAEELCGYASVLKDVQLADSLPPIAQNGARFLGTGLGLVAGFANQKYNTLYSCPTGYVTFRVRAGATIQWSESFGIASFRFDGVYESDCISIDDLPSSGSWLSGKTVSIPLVGVYDYNSAFLRCNLAPQTITVAFS